MANQPEKVAAVNVSERSAEKDSQAERQMTSRHGHTGKGAQPKLTVTAVMAAPMALTLTPGGQAACHPAQGLWLGR